MVKVDVTKDYYAALGVGPNADTDEIKKKFRKLALKYHPDRNPGKEVEFNAKFQAIQAAHEVLVDPQQRLKYDTDRLRAGYGKLYSPRPSASARPPPTPYQTQPRRPTPSQAYKQGYQTSGSYQPPPSAGAQKYSSYAKAQAQNWDKAYREAHTRADAFRGFQDMKNNSGGTAGGWSNIDPRTGRPTGAQGQRPQSAYDSYFTPPRPFQPGPRRSQTTKKKNGFAPGNPDGDDEPMATNTSAYVNVARGERAQASYPQPTFEPASAPTAKRPERTATANGQPNLERTSSKYATTGGEKTYFSAAGLWRSASTRDPPSQDSDSRSRTNPPSPTSSQPSHGRHHSASPKMRPNRDRTFSSSSTESSGLSDVDVPWRPKARPRSRKFANAAKSSGWENYNSGHNSESTTFTKNRPVHEQATSGTGPTFTSSSHPQPNNLPKQHNDTNGPKDKAGLNNSNIFDTSTLKATLEKNQGSLNGKSKSKSHENIDVGFSAADWNVKFESGANIFNPTPSNNAQAQKPKTERGRTTSRPRSASSAQPTSAFKPPAQPAPGAAPFQGTQPSQPIPTFTGTPFSANNWAELLRDNLWTKPHNEPQQKDKVDTQRQKSPKKQPKAPSKRTNVPKPASVSTEADEAAKTYKTGDTDNVKQGGNVDGEAMDIDGGAPAPRNEKRTTADKTTPTGSGTATPTTNKKPKAEPKSHLFNLKKLGLVSPFAPNNTGINDLNDLSNTLPFESRAENSSGARINIRPRDLALPKPPKTPAPPKLITEPSPAGEKPLAVLPQAAWDCYIAEMSAYFHEWNVFNRSMLGHFNARQATVDTGLAPKWMSSVGNSGKLNIDRDADLSPSQQGGAGNDNTSTGTAGAFVDDEELVAGSAKGGFNAYLRGVEEDFVVRQHWEVACERHRECMLTLGRVRQWIRNGGKIRPFARSSG